MPLDDCATLCLSVRLSVHTWIASTLWCWNAAAVCICVGVHITATFNFYVVLSLEENCKNTKKKLSHFIPRSTSCLYCTSFALSFSLRLHLSLFLSEWGGEGRRVGGEEVEGGGKSRFLVVSTGYTELISYWNNVITIS